MKLLDKKRLHIVKVERIGGLIPINKMTLITGLPGSGKSYSTIKFLNIHDITPIYFNLEETEIGDLKAEQFGSGELMDLLDGNYTDLDGHVVILDTYTRVEQITGYTKEVLANIVDKLAEHYNATIILIAHPEEYVGKDGIFKDNQMIARNSYEFLHLEREIKSQTSKGVTVKTTNHTLFVNKGRGLTTDRIIPNWVRD